MKVCLQAEAYKARDQELDGAGSDRLLLKFLRLIHEPSRNSRTVRVI